MSATFGPTLPEPSAYFDPETSCWRMSGGMFPSDSMPSLATFPAWGMTRNGALYELPTPALPTAEPASSSLLPTPAVNDMGAGKTVEAWDEWTARMQAKHSNGNGHGPSLAIEAQRLLPTPVTDPMSHNGHARNLASEAQLLPTPTRSDANGAGAHGDGGTDLRTALLGTPTSRIHKGGSSAQREAGAPKARLEDQVTLLPTPTAQDAAGSRNSTHPRPPGSTANIGDTLTDAATVLTGARTRARSAVGKPSPDGTPPDLLSQDEPESA